MSDPVHIMALLARYAAYVGGPCFEGYESKMPQSGAYAVHSTTPTLLIISKSTSGSVGAFAFRGDPFVSNKEKFSDLFVFLLFVSHS